MDRVGIICAAGKPDYFRFRIAAAACDFFSDKLGTFDRVDDEYLITNTDRAV